MNRHVPRILCVAICLLYPLRAYGDFFGNALSAIEHNAGHISIPTRPNPAARPVASTTPGPVGGIPMPGTIAVQTGAGASVPFSGPVGSPNLGGGPPIVTPPAPVVSPGTVTLQIPPGGGPTSGGTITNTGSSANGANFGGQAAEGIFTAIMTGGLELTDPRRPSAGSYGRVATRPYNRVASQQGQAREPLHREPSKEPSGMHQSVTGNAYPRPIRPMAGHTPSTNAIHGTHPRPGLHPMAVHPTGQHHAVTYAPHPAHTVQRSVAKLSHVGHPSQHRAAAHR